MKLKITEEELHIIIRVLSDHSYPEFAKQLRNQDPTDDGPEVTILSVDSKS